MGGGDKCLMALADKPLLAHAIDKLAPQCAALVLNANGPTERFAEFDLPIMADPVAGFVGPLAGILAGCRWSARHFPSHSHIVSAAADTPFFPADLVARLIDENAGNPDTIVLATSNDRVHPVFGLWPVAQADALEAWLAGPDNRKILKWVDLHPNHKADFAVTASGDPFFNINTPDDLAGAHAYLGKTA